MKYRLPSTEEAISNGFPVYQARIGESGIKDYRPIAGKPLRLDLVKEENREELMRRLRSPL